MRLVLDKISFLAPSLGFEECNYSISSLSKLVTINSGPTDPPLLQSNIYIEEEIYGRFENGVANKKSRQARIDAHLSKKACMDYMQMVKDFANYPKDDDNHLSRLLYRNLVSSINASFGAWINSVKNEFNCVSPHELKAACCRRNTMATLAILCRLCVMCSYDGIV